MSTENVIVRRLTSGYQSVAQRYPGSPAGVLFFREAPTAYVSPGVVSFTLQQAQRYRWNFGARETHGCEPKVGPSTDATRPGRNGNVWISPFQALSDIDLCSGHWMEASWPSGTTCLVLFGIPRTLGHAELLQMLRKLTAPMIQQMDIVSLRLCFGDEHICLNPLSETLDSGNNSVAAARHFLASVEFREEGVARTLWELCSAGNLKLYGHTLGAVPDPSGYRVFGEAVAANFSRDDVDRSSTCPCCMPLPRDQATLPPQTTMPEYQVFLPYVSEQWTETLLKHCPSLKHVRITWLPSFLGTLVVFPTVKALDAFCLPQRYEFRASDHVTVHAGSFRLGRKITPCILGPPKLPLSSAYLHSVEVQQHAAQPSGHLPKQHLQESVDGPSTTQGVPPPPVQSSAPSGRTKRGEPSENTRRSSVASKKRAKVAQGGGLLPLLDPPDVQQQRDNASTTCCPLPRRSAPSPTTSSHSKMEDSEQQNDTATAPVAPSTTRGGGVSSSLLPPPPVQGRRPPTRSRTAKLLEQQQTAAVAAAVDSASPSCPAPPPVKRGRGRPKGSTKRKVNDTT